jgi:hypothetical protein
VAEEERGGGGGAAGEAGGGAERSRFVEGKDWNGGTHGLGCKIGKLLEQFVFWDENNFTPPPITSYRGSNFLHLLELL